MINPVVLKKGIKFPYAFCEPFQNGVAAFVKNNQTNPKILFEIIENDKDFYVLIKNNGEAVSKKNMSSVMNIGMSEKDTVFNENGEGLKAYVFLNNPSDNDWFIKSNAAEGAFKVVGPWMDWRYDENYNEWDEGDAYNFVLGTCVENEKGREFYRNITAEYIAFQFLPLDHNGWTLRKNLDGVITEENIPTFRIWDNKYVHLDDASSIVDKLYVQENGSSFKMSSYHVYTDNNDKTPNEKATVKRSDLIMRDPEALLFSIPDFTGRTFADLCSKGKGGNLLRNINMQGLYIYVNGRFATKQGMNILGFEQNEHQHWNPFTTFVFIETNNISFPSDANKRGFDFTSENAQVFIEALIDQNKAWYEENWQTERERQKRKNVDRMTIWTAEETGVIKVNKEAKFRDDPTSTRVDTAIYDEDNNPLLVREYKRDIIKSQDIWQVFGYVANHITKMISEHPTMQYENSKNYADGKQINFPSFSIYAEGLSEGAKADLDVAIKGLNLMIEKYSKHPKYEIGKNIFIRKYSELEESE